MGVEEEMDDVQTKKDVSDVSFRFSLGFWLLFFFFLFCHRGSMWEFLGQGLNLDTAATRATLARMQEPQPRGPSENSLILTFNHIK